MMITQLIVVACLKMGDEANSGCQKEDQVSSLYMLSPALSDAENLRTYVQLPRSPILVTGQRNEDRATPRMHQLCA